MKFEPCYCFQAIDYEELLTQCEIYLSKLDNLNTMITIDDKTISGNELLKQIQYTLKQYQFFQKEYMKNG